MPRDLRAGDLLHGGRGADIFRLNLGDGSDTILDFGNRADLISLVDTCLTFEDMFQRQDKSAAVVEAGDVTIRLKNTGVEDLDEAALLL